MIFLLTLGAVARITRFITTDYLFRGVRNWSLRITAFPDGELNPDHDFPFLLTCPWCMSIWVAGGAYPLAWFYGHTAAFLIVTCALSASYVYAVVTPLLDPSEPESADPD